MKRMIFISTLKSSSARRMKSRMKITTRMKVAVVMSMLLLQSPKKEFKSWTVMISNSKY